MTPTTTEFSFRPERPVRFSAGQYLELHLPHSRTLGRADGKGRRRVFSLTSAPGSGLVTIGAGTAEPVSSAKRSLLALQPGDELTATTVGGDFVLPRSKAPVLLIAAGIGITPFLAQLAAGAARDRDAVLLYLARSAAELAYAEQLERSGARILARLADGSAPPPFMQDAGKGCGGRGFRRRGTGPAGRGGAEGTRTRHRRPGGVHLRFTGQRPLPPAPRHSAPGRGGSAWTPSPATEYGCRNRQRRAGFRADFPLEATFLLSSRTSRR